MGKILIKRGTKTNFTNVNLDIGELAICTDTGELYGGTTTGKVKLSSDIISVNGQTGTVNITSITGNSGSATKLQTSRKIALGGEITGNASFDGSSDITISATIPTIDGGTF